MNTIFQATEHPIVVERTADFWGHYHSLLAVPSCSPLDSSQTLLSSFLLSSPCPFSPLLSSSPSPFLHHVHQFKAGWKQAATGGLRQEEGWEELPGGKKGRESEMYMELENTVKENEGAEKEGRKKTRRAWGASSDEWAGNWTQEGAWQEWKGGRTDGNVEGDDQILEFKYAVWEMLPLKVED